MKRTYLNARSKSDPAVLKRKIQALVREIVIARDGTCILRGVRRCNDPVLQADHLITRANSATYADTRLIVCLCRACHGGFKQWHKGAYDNLVKTIISKERTELWEKCEKESWSPRRTTAQDWRLQVIILERELELYNKN